ncbi:MFS transporter [Sulfitobacter sp.]|uniref:MFS transporter n=1 Tax=Sulfitobacter sp. TaxID=1903071 RepID=UPI0030018937
MNTAPVVPEQTRFRWFILFGVWLIYFSFGVAIASMAPMIAPISVDLGAGYTLMGGILGAWPLAYIVAAIPCGILLDKFGVRSMLLVATLIMAASLFARSFADTPMQMMLAVALFGLGGPLISVGAPKTIAHLFDGTQRATAMGIYVTGPYLGGIFALGLTNSVALPLADGDWRGVMLIYAGLVLTAGVIWFAITCHPEFDKQGSGAEQGKKFNLAAFRDILHLPEVRLILAMSIGIFFINHALNNWLPELLRDRGFTPVEAGLWAAIPSAMGVLGVLAIPRLATPERRLAIMGGLFCMSFLASLLLQSNASAVLASGLVLQGLARGSMMTIAILILMETPNIPPERLGLAGGMFFTSAEIGGVLGPFSFGLLSDLSAGFVLPLMSISLISLGLLLVLFQLRKSQA